MDSESAKAQILQIPGVSNQDHVKYGITKPLSIFEQRISVVASKYDRRRFQESNEQQTGENNPHENKQHSDIIQVAKRVRVCRVPTKSVYVQYLNYISLATASKIFIAVPQRR